MPSELRKSRLGLLVNGLAVAAIGWVCVMLVLISLLGDRWWVGTIALFAPRWMLALPTLSGVLLLPWLSRRLKCAVLASGLAACWGVLGLCVPWTGWFSQPETSYRILTCNVAGWSGGPEKLERLIRDSQPDVVMLQELRYSDQSGFSLPDGWFSFQEKRVLIASRFPLNRVQSVKTTARWPTTLGLFCDAETPEGTIRIGTLHLSSPRHGLSAVFDSKTIIAPSRRGLLVEETAQRRAVSKRISEVASSPDGAMVIGGDFNMPVESYFFRKHWRGFCDAYSSAGFGVGNTASAELGRIHWESRIDHIITRDRWHASRCWVGPDVGSDHRPLLADIYLE